jgi:Protein tyrosine/serine phosphatase
MKKQLLLLSKTFMLVTILTGTVSCSDDDTISSKMHLYGGMDITSYATVTAQSETKKSGIDILRNGTWKLYNINDLNTPMLNGNTTGYSELGSTDYRQYCLEWSDGSRAVFAPRQLPMEGQPNFRDLGGYKTTAGKFVRWGRVLRSGKCNNLTGSDLQYLATVPLKTVVDFRSDDERDAEPDRVPNTVTLQIHYPINPGNLSNVDISEAISRGDVEACKQYLVDANEQLVLHFQDEYKAFFVDLMEGSKTPLMFHCTAGKDRAGFASAMFLASLGVDRETIIKDYLLTNEMTGVTIEGMKGIYGDNDVAVCMYYISSVQKEYIEKAFLTIEENYGTVESYLTNQLGVDLNKMKKLYLY